MCKNRCYLEVESFLTHFPSKGITNRVLCLRDPFPPNNSILKQIAGKLSIMEQYGVLIVMSSIEERNHILFNSPKANWRGGEKGYYKIPHWRSPSLYTSGITRSNRKGQYNKGWIIGVGDGDPYSLQGKTVSAIPTDNPSGPNGIR